VELSDPLVAGCMQPDKRYLNPCSNSVETLEQILCSFFKGSTRVISYTEPWPDIYLTLIYLNLHANNFLVFMTILNRNFVAPMLKINLNQQLLSFCIFFK